ncbi:4197_t:CDS:2 [Entrophospora sp. SA101]|nr:4197_t:CDS:2 [Entrophospora sp. SA101]
MTIKKETCSVAVEVLTTGIEVTRNVGSNLDIVQQTINVASEAIKPFVPLIGLVTDLAGQIIEVYENAQYNKKICDAFLDRIDALQASIKTLQRRKEENQKTFQDKGYYNNFVRLVDVLRKVKVFLDNVTRLHGYKKYLNANSVKEKFGTLTNEFDTVVHDLHFALTVSAQRQKTIHGGIIDEEQKLNTVLQEVMIIKGQIESLENNKPAPPDDNPIKAVQVLPSELEDPMYPKKTDRRGKSPYIVKKTLRKVIEVACKSVTIPNEEENSHEYQKAQGLFTILGKLRESDHIIKFYGLSTIDKATVIVLEWAELGSLKKVYEEYDIKWRTKMDKNQKTKIANFDYARHISGETIDMKHMTEIVHWLAPEKLRYEQKQPYNFKCEIFSFGMLLWELAFEVVPYGKWDMTKVKKHVLAGGRENIQFGDDVDDETKNLQQEYAEIIKGAWKADPLSRSLLQKIFLELDGLHSKYPPPVAESRLGPSKSIDFDGSLKEGKKPVSISEEDGSIQLNKFPQSSTTMMLDDGIKAHKAKDHKTAWACFQKHADFNNPKVKYWKGYYLWEGYCGRKDKVAAAKLFKEAADGGVPDAQLRYAFSMIGNKANFNEEEFIRYLKLAANNDNSTAQYSLGDVYINGKLDITKDEEEGIKYLKLAALNKHPKANELLKQMKINIYS